MNRKGKIVSAQLRVMLTIVIGLIGLGVILVCIPLGGLTNAADTVSFAQPSGPPFLNTRFVATSGNDSNNDCTDSATPCRAIQHAVDVAADGDEIRIATGVYTDVAERPRDDITTTGAVTQMVTSAKP